MLSDFASYDNSTESSWYFAVLTDFFYWCSYFHDDFLISIGNPSFGQIVRSDLNANLVAGSEPDFIHSHFSWEMTDNHCAAFKFDFKFSAGQQLFYSAAHFQRLLASRDIRIKIIHCTLKKCLPILTKYNISCNFSCKNFSKNIGFLIFFWMTIV